MISQGDHNLLRNFLGHLLVWPVMASVLAGFFVVGHQCLGWPKFAYWQEMTLQDAMYWLFGDYFYSQMGWLGIDKIVNWCVDNLPLALWLFIILPTIWLVGWRWLRNVVVAWRESQGAR